MSEEQAATQKTRPRGTDEHGESHEPIEIPVPKRKDVEDALDRLIGVTPDEEKSHRRP